MPPSQRRRYRKKMTDVGGGAFPVSPMMGGGEMPIEASDRSISRERPLQPVSVKRRSIAISNESKRAPQSPRAIAAANAVSKFRKSRHRKIVPRKESSNTV